jgi:flagellar protein FlgJ
MATRPKLGNREKQLFIESIGPLARSSQQRTGVPASVTITQACLESDWGRSGLSRPPYYNFFGIKARVGEKYAEFNTTEFKGGIAEIQKARFRDFLSIGECFDAHAGLLSKAKRYAPAMAVADDPLAFAAKLQQCGYATDPMYAEKLARIMCEFNLTRFDVKKQKAVGVS